MSDDPDQSSVVPGSSGRRSTDPAGFAVFRNRQTELLPVSQPPVDESDLEQSVRAEMLGTLANGVTHEFNNLVTVMLASLHQLRRQPLDEQGQKQLERVERTAQQAGRLTGQMLSFIRHEHSQLQALDLNKVVSEFDKMMEHAAGYGTGLSVKLELASQSLPVRLDVRQLELALLNLVRNAADAMAGGGIVVVQTAGHRFDGLGPQPTVEVSVSDTGAGMPPKIVQRITAPFFTTREPGRDTGQGLWMVQRFATAYGGKLKIETVAGQGTTVRLSFPRNDKE